MQDELIPGGEESKPEREPDSSGRRGPELPEKILDGILANLITPSGLVSPLNMALDEERRKKMLAVEKLALASRLELLAEEIETSPADRAALVTKRTRMKLCLEKAKSVGIGSMLRDLRPSEELAHRLCLWRKNGQHSAKSEVPRDQTTVLVCQPEWLQKVSFQRAFAAELAQTNDKIFAGKYRSLVLLPMEHFEQRSEVLPYLECAQRSFCTVVGSIDLGPSRKDVGSLIKKWQFLPADAKTPSERSALSHLVLVANDTVIRPARSEYSESQPLTLGLEAAYAAQMTLYANRSTQIDGFWYAPITHPLQLPENAQVVNSVLTLQELHALVEHRINVVYQVLGEDEPGDPGMRFYGVATAYPTADINWRNPGVDILPLAQAQVRWTKNRISFFLRTQLERFCGGFANVPSVHALVDGYLQSMMASNQIRSYRIDKCIEDDGRLTIVLRVTWLAMIEGAEVFFVAESESKKTS